MKEFALNQTYAKVLLTISDLNKLSYYPLNEGIYKILAGVIDDETGPFTSIVTFGTLTSYSSKKICHLSLMLFKRGYIERIFDSVTKKLYFRVSKKGEEALNSFFKRHRCSFAKRKPKTAITIAKIV